jgi:muramidase (phage lysozyme)
MPVVVIALFLMMSPYAAIAEALRGSAFNTSGRMAGAAKSGVFVAHASDGLFAERRPSRSIFDKMDQALQGSDVQRIRALIQEAESRKDGYDAVQHGARIGPPKRPTDMTLAEVFAWIDATPNQPHAIGRYQFIPKTLRRVVAKIGVKLSQRFTPEVQDQLADVLLIEAGLNKFRTGQLDRVAFMNNIAKIWAGLPNSTGKSHYDGYAGNKAVLTWARFDAVMAQIAPNSG